MNALIDEWRGGNSLLSATRSLPLLLAIAIALTACAGRDTNHPTGATQLVDISLQPARVPPNQQGALMLSTVTGCYMEYVGRGARETVYQFLMAPTQRVPSFDQCLASLRTQPGVTAADIAR